MNCKFLLYTHTLSVKMLVIKFSSSLCLPVLPELFDNASSSSGCVDLDSGKTELVSWSAVELEGSSLATLLVEGDEGSSRAPGPRRGTRYSVVCCTCRHELLFAAGRMMVASRSAEGGRWNTGNLAFITSGSCNIMLTFSTISTRQQSQILRLEKVSLCLVKFCQVVIDISKYFLNSWDSQPILVIVESFLICSSIINFLL